MIKYGKGVNLTLSFVYDYLLKLNTEYNKHIKKLVIYFDNCGGQNKNNTTLQFYHWLCYYKQMFEEIEIFTMEKGHTKFSPDRHFGWMKKKYNDTEKVETFKDCKEVII